MADLIVYFKKPTDWANTLHILGHSTASDADRLARYADECYRKRLVRLSV